MTLRKLSPDRGISQCITSLPPDTDPELVPRDPIIQNSPLQSHKHAYPVEEIPCTASPISPIQDEPVIEIFPDPLDDESQNDGNNI